jgi:hypothetical protein
MSSTGNGSLRVNASALKCWPPMGAIRLRKAGRSTCSLARSHFVLHGNGQQSCMVRMVVFIQQHRGSWEVAGSFDWITPAH